MVFSLFQIKLHVDFIFGVFQIAFIFLLNDLAEGNGYSKNMVFAVEEDLVPQDGTQVYIKAVAKESNYPFKKEHATCSIIFFEVSID